MRFPYIILLAAVITIIGVDASRSTGLRMIQSESVVDAEKDVPANRILRSPATALENDEEERAWYSGFTNPIKSKFSSKATTNVVAKADLDHTGDDVLNRLIRKNPSVNVAFTNLNLKMGDDLITQTKFKPLFNYIDHLNQKPTGGTSVVEFLKSQSQSDEQIVKMFIKASKSNHKDVKAMGESIMLDLIRQWLNLTPMKPVHEVDKISKPLGKIYKSFFDKVKVRPRTE